MANFPEGIAEDIFSATSRTLYQRDLGVLMGRFWRQIVSKKEESDHGPVRFSKRCPARILWGALE